MYSEHLKSITVVDDGNHVTGKLADLLPVREVDHLELEDGLLVQVAKVGHLNKNISQLTALQHTNKY